MSSFVLPGASAPFGERWRTLSHTSFVSGFGISCSQPQFAKRPSWIPGSGLRTSSNAPAGAGRAAARGPGGLGGRAVGVGGEGLGRESRPLDDAVVERLPPEDVEAGRAPLAPLGLEDLAALRRRLPEDRGEDLVRRLPAVHRPAERLGDARRCRR